MAWDGAGNPGHGSRSFVVFGESHLAERWRGSSVRQLIFLRFKGERLALMDLEVFRLAAVSQAVCGGHRLERGGGSGGDVPNQCGTVTVAVNGMRVQHVPSSTDFA